VILSDGHSLSYNDVIFMKEYFDKLSNKNKNFNVKCKNEILKKY